MKKSIENEIYIEIRKLDVGHNVIKMKLECHLKWFSTTTTIEGLGQAVELSNTLPLTLCTFKHFETTHSGQEKLLWKIH